MNIINNKSRLLFWSDLHLSHSNVYKFTSSVDPTKKMRPFYSMGECEELMVNNYNRVVQQDDIVYFMGDIWFNKKHAYLLDKMKKGSKRLIMGNHDNKGDVAVYRQYFDKVHGVLYLNKIKAIGSHIPIHPRFLCKDECADQVRFLYNLHGHTHDHFVLREDGSKDPRYLNCSVEVVNYTPVTLEELIEINGRI